MVKSDDDKKMLALVQKDIESLPDYAQHKDYYQKLVKACHSQAFEKAYKIGGRREANSMDEKLYYRELLRAMADKAKDDGEKDVAAMLFVTLLGLELIKV